MSGIPEQEKVTSQPPAETKDAASQPENAQAVGGEEQHELLASSSGQPPNPPPKELSGEDDRAAQADGLNDSNNGTDVPVKETTPKQRRPSTIPGIACSCVALVLFVLAYFMATSVGSLAREASRAASQAQPAVAPLPVPPAPAAAPVPASPAPAAAPVPASPAPAAAPVPASPAPIVPPLPAPLAPAAALAIPSLPPGPAIDAAAAWQAAAGRNINAIFQTASEKNRLMRFNWWITKPEAFSLRVPFWLILIGFLLLVAGSGLVLGGDAFLGVVDPNTGCSSLSRVQALAWTGVILGGFSVMALCNIAFGAATAVAAGTEVSLFPGIDGNLLGLLGIVAGSPIAASYFSATAQGQTPARDPQTIHGVRNRIYQIMVDDSPGGSGNMDLTRLQCIFITIILLGCYGAMLDQILASIDAKAIRAASITPNYRPLFAALPAITDSFMLLLLASHSLFQASKSPLGQQFTRKPGS